MAANLQSMVSEVDELVDEIQTEILQVGNQLKLCLLPLLYELDMQSQGIWNSPYMPAVSHKSSSTV